jgi:hypothetical protein
VGRKENKSVSISEKIRVTLEKLQINYTFKPISPNLLVIFSYKKIKIISFLRIK